MCKLRALMDIGLLLLRLTTGLTLAAHGAQKLFGWFGGPGLGSTAQFFEVLGFAPGRRRALMAGLVEIVAALTLAFTGPGSLSLDALLGHCLSGARWGVAALLAGIIGGVIQLMQRRRASTQQTATAK